MTESQSGKEGMIFLSKAKEEKRELILNAAIKVFSEEGLTKAKVSDVVKEAGVAQGTFYLYFPSKFSLVPAIAERMLEHTFLSVKEHTDLEKPLKEQIEQIIDAIFLVTEKYQEVLALCYSGMSISGDIHKWESIYEPFYAWVTSWLKEAQKKQEIRSDLNPWFVARMMVGLIEETAEQIYLFDSNYGEETEDKKELIDFLCHALGVKK